jgi:hypothetical protein
MSADKITKIDHEINEIHTHIQKSNINLRAKIKMIQDELCDWPSLTTKDVKRKNRKSVR